MALVINSLVLAADFNQLYTNLDNERVRHQLSKNNSSVIAGSQAKANDAKNLNDQINNTFLNSKFVNTVTYNFENVSVNNIMRADLMSVYNSALTTLQSACLNYSNKSSDRNGYSSSCSGNRSDRSHNSNYSSDDSSYYSRHSTSCANFSGGGNCTTDYTNQSHRQGYCGGNTGQCGHLAAYQGNNHGCHGDNTGNCPNNYADRGNNGSDYNSNHSTNRSGDGCGVHFSNDFKADYGDRSGYCHYTSGGTCTNKSNRSSDYGNYTNKTSDVPGINK